MLKEKNILITGGNSGIGLFATINLLKTKNNLYIPIRSSTRREKFFLKLLEYFDKNSSLLFEDLIRMYKLFLVFNKLIVANKPIPELPPVIKIFFSFNIRI